MIDIVSFRAQAPHHAVWEVVICRSGMIWFQEMQGLTRMLHENAVFLHSGLRGDSAMDRSNLADLTAPVATPS
jgi:hypothetical protein